MSKKEISPAERHLYLRIKNVLEVVKIWRKEHTERLDRLEKVLTDLLIVLSDKGIIGDKVENIKKMFKEGGG